MADDVLKKKRKEKKQIGPYDWFYGPGSHLLIWCNLQKISSHEIFEEHFWIILS